MHEWYFKMILLECLFILISALGCYAAPAWDAEKPPDEKCLRPDIENGKILSGWFRRWFFKTSHFPMDVDDYIYFICEEGFVSPNRQQIEITYCRREGWSPQPKCKKPCSIPSGENINYYTSNGPYYEGDKIWFRCIPGYETQDGRTEAQVECINGRFAEEICFKFCKKPDLRNGFLDITRTKLEIGSVITFTCDEGFYSENKRNKDIIECTNAGWTPLPQCKEITCALENTYNIYKSGDVLHFKCKEDDELEGQDSSQCFYYGWGPKVPVCKAKYRDLETESTFTPMIIKKDGLPDSKCPPAFPPPNAEVKYLNNNEKEAEIQCNPGYILEGPAKFSCENGKWQSPSMCSPKKICPHPPPVVNSEIIDDPKEYYSGSTIKYRCKDGYHMITSDTCTCVHGRWVTPPTCEGNTCGEAEKIENGKVNSDKIEYKHGERAIYECSEGFKLTGNAAICDRGKWLYIPQCINTRCAHPPQILNGEALGVIQEKYNTGERVEYQCIAGYSMKGDLNYVTCKDSQWTEKPVCRKTGQSCGMPPTVNFGDIKEVQQSSYSSGSSVTFVCIHLYKLEGNEKIKCTDGEWEKEPICRGPCTVRKSDMQINNIRFKNVNVKKLYMEHFDYTTFECLSGFDISDEKLLTIQCLDGELNYPKCFNQETRQSCGMPPTIKFGDIRIKQSSYSSGSSVTYVCKYLHKLEGNEKIKCTDGEWEKEPICREPCTVRKSDMQINNIQFKNLNIEKIYMEHLDYTSFECLIGFGISDEKLLTILCLDGELYYPKCFKQGATSL